MRRRANLKWLVPLLLVLILILAVCCFTTHSHPLDLFVPILVIAFILLPDTRPSFTTRREQFGPALKVYLPTAPDRAPPVTSAYLPLSLLTS
jgi:hypothetical protein